MQAAINASLTDLPSDLPSIPSFRKFNPAASPVLILALTSKTVPPSAIYDAADTVVAQRIAQVSGVADVTVSGAEQPAMRVRVNPGAIAAAGISLEQVRTAIAGANAQSPLGVLDGSDLSETHRHQRSAAPRARLQDAGGQEQRTATSCGSPTSRRVEQSTRNSRSAAWFNRQPSVLLIITKQGDANVIETVDNIRALIPEIKRWIPADIDISILSDRTGTIRASVADMQLTLAGTIALVMLVVFLFLRRATPTIAAGVTVPLSLAGTCALMWCVGLLDRQSVADGARGLGRLRGRRRDRDDRERVPQHGEGPFAAARHDRGRAPDRLHGDLDQRLADRGVHPAAVHGRDRRARVPRILGHAGVRDPRSRPSCRSPSRR